MIERQLQNMEKVPRVLGPETIVVFVGGREDVGSKVDDIDLKFVFYSKRRDQDTVRVQHRNDKVHQEMCAYA